MSGCLPGTQEGKTVHRRILAVGSSGDCNVFPCVLAPWLFDLWLDECVCSHTHTLLLFELHLGLMLAFPEPLCSPPFPNQVGTTKEKTLFNLLWTSWASQTKVHCVQQTQKWLLLSKSPSAPFDSCPLLQEAHLKTIIVLAQSLANIPRKGAKSKYLGLVSLHVCCCRHPALLL